MGMNVYTDSQYGAQQLATVEFQKVAGEKVREYDITVVLCESMAQIAHSGDTRMSTFEDAWAVYMDIRHGPMLS